MKQIEVQIMGQSYLLGCPDGGEARLRDAVEKVDGAMCRIRDAGKVKARDRIAVLAALNLAFDLADKPVAAAAAAAPAASAEGASGHAGALDDDASQARLAQLVQRLDQALGQDGQLL
ncbi:cell division protein ZapA [Ramlibacter sp. MAHUQ-53]|uniref:cell division protein ZapA n=1 Tax=unclassified Ramlibacter TaxID=2617605 RepID=UPI00363D7860